MSNNPFFSVIIPTKNRSHLVGFAIQSVLDQTFKNFEIIVSDNDDSDTLTREAVAGFSDPRIKYFRTSGKLSMADNWQYGLSISKGHYITILEDKQALYPDALEIIHKVAIERDPKVISWCEDRLNDTKGKNTLILNHETNKVSQISSDDILSRTVEDIYSQWSYLPRMLNSCARRDFVEFVQKESKLERFFVPISPDLCAAFIQLNYVDTITHISTGLTIWGYPSLSLGRLFRKKAAGHEKTFHDFGSKETFCSHVPIKSYYIQSSCIYNDYLVLREKFDGKLRKHSVTPRNYILMCYKSMAENRVLGADISKELALFNEYINKQEPSVRKGLWHRFLIISAIPYMGKLLKPFSKVKKLLAWTLFSKTMILKPYDNILSAARDNTLRTRKIDYDYDKP